MSVANLLAYLAGGGPLADHVERERSRVYQAAYTEDKTPPSDPIPAGFTVTEDWYRFHFDGNGYDWRRELRKAGEG